MMPFDSDPAMQARYETFMNYVSEALHAGQERMDRIEERINCGGDDIRKNTAITEAHREETREMIEVFSSLKGGFKVLEWIGKFAKVVGGIALAFSAVIAAYQAMVRFFK